MSLNIAVTGGGAAGFFAAIHAAHENSSVTLFEKSNKLLAKVRISGGGRCNVTHACFDPARLVEYYPRGRKELRNAFARFHAQHTVEWFQSRGVRLKAEEDGRMFPVTDDSATIINCLSQEAEKNKVKIRLQHAVEKTEVKNNAFILHFANGNKEQFDRLIITSGGSPSLKHYEWLQQLGHTILPPVPSLFTFNIPHSPLKGLEGVATHATVKIKDDKRQETGPLLITHWGISGPAVIRLSAWAARQLHEVNYETTVYINWLPEFTIETFKTELDRIRQQHAAKKVMSSSFELPQRLWERLCELSGITSTDNYADLSKQKINRLTENLLNMPLQLRGKTTYKEEFVTCGGISLKEVDMQTMESKKVKGLFFAGEVLDIDGVTGGFNFQSAWTTGYLAGLNAARVKK